MIFELLKRAYKHHCTTSLPLAIENYGSREAAYKEGEQLWLRDIPTFFKFSSALHKKTGNVYEVLGEVINATNAQSGQKMFLYSRDGKYYVREVEEFGTKFEVM